MKENPPAILLKDRGCMATSFSRVQPEWTPNATLLTAGVMSGMTGPSLDDYLWRDVKHEVPLSVDAAPA
jgi:hypothetical protein